MPSPDGPPRTTTRLSAHVTLPEPLAETARRPHVSRKSDRVGHMGAFARPDRERRLAIARGIRARHGAGWRDVAARQAKVARNAADAFEAAGDPTMAAVLRRHAGHLEHLRRLPTVRRKVATA